MDLVSDSSGLIVLTRLGLLAKAARLFERVVVPPAVVRELEAGRPRTDAEVLLRALDDGTLLRARQPPQLAFPLPASLAAGEREAIALAVHRKAAVLLDDRAAGRAATALGLRVLRTGRVLLLLVDEGELTVAEFEAALHRMGEMGFRLSPRAYLALLDEARKRSK